ncbi:zinc-ribbon domain-containing protein [Flavobacterium sp. ASV13]|uniref:zinc-ribbon domain-containing protein n=1 Tax=Flavobacterium sp. ASV13 TaxID=1506583 RepID=UPI0005500A7B|nr:zinc-ribbon domain-containing protein [Flavobacterium sp. ASV13]
MIFYGTKAANIKNDQVLNVDCSHCDSKVTMRYSIFEKYAHIYWIPFFPIKKLIFAECNSCKKTFERHELPTPTQQKIDRSKGKVNSPFWMFSGLMIIGAFVLYGFYSSVQTTKDTENFIQSPKIGDVYLINSSTGFYSTMKLDEISKDSLVLLINNMEIDNKEEIGKIDLKENYVNKKTIAKRELQKLLTENKIYEVVRH